MLAQGGIMDLQKNLETLRQNIASTAKSAGRSPESIKLVAVSKTVDHTTIKKVFNLGQFTFGENRAQALRDKNKLLELLDIDWHFIGPLQSNKVKYVYPVASLVHSIDSISLIEQFIAWYEKTSYKCPFLLEMNISGESNKQGFSEDELLEAVSKFKDHPALDIRGLMGMAPFVSDEKIVRASFRSLAETFEKTKKMQGTAYKALELSMGMTNDYKIAIEEGATILRVGSALFSSEQ